MLELKLTASHLHRKHISFKLKVGKVSCFRIEFGERRIIKRLQNCIPGYLLVREAQCRRVDRRDSARGGRASLA